MFNVQYRKTYRISVIGHDILLIGSERIMVDKQKPKIIKAPIKQVHLECDMALYKKFERYCHMNGKSVSAALRAYMKMCIGE